jgi:hypothetical protein
MSPRKPALVGLLDSAPAFGASAQFVYQPGEATAVVRKDDVAGLERTMRGEDPVSFHHRGERIDVPAMIGVGASGLATERCFEVGWQVGHRKAEHVSGFAA